MLRRRLLAWGAPPVGLRISHQSVRSSGSLARQFAEAEQQAAGLFMLGSACAVLLRALSYFIQENTWMSDFCVVCVAVVYLVSAYVYWNLYSVLSGPSPHWTETWAERLNIGAGLASVGLSLVNMWAEVESVQPALASAEFGLSAVYFIDTLLYFECWKRKNGKDSACDSSLLYDMSYWANVLNVFPASLYLLACAVSLLEGLAPLRAMGNIAPSTTKDILLASSEGIWFIDSLLVYRCTQIALREARVYSVAGLEV